MAGNFTLSNTCVPRSGEPGGTCSGRGVCIEIDIPGAQSTAACICPEGWSSIGDLATDPSVDCGINLTAVRALWGICACANFLLLLLSCGRLFFLRHHFTLKGIRRADVKVFFCCGIQGFFFTIVGVLQAVNTKPGARSVGIDPLTTSLFAVGSSALFFAFAGYYFSLLKIAVQQVRLTVQDESPMNERYIKLVRMTFPVYFVFSLFGSFIVFGFLGGNPKNDQLYGSLHYLSYVAAISMMLIYTVVMTYPLQKQVKMLRKNGTSDSGVNQAQKILDQTMKHVFMDVSVQNTINILMGSIPILLRKVSYQMPIAWCVIALGCFDVFRHFNAQGANSSRGVSTGASNGKVRQVEAITSTVHVGSTVMTSGGG